MRDNKQNTSKGDLVAKEQQVKEALKQGQEIKVSGRPVRLVGKNLFVEVRSRRGRGFSHFTHEDLLSISL